MKFILVMQLCSFSLGTCDVPMERSMPFNSYEECAISGHLHSLQIIRQLGPEFINEHQTIIRHWCQKKHEI